MKHRVLFLFFLFFICAMASASHVRVQGNLSNRSGGSVGLQLGRPEQFYCPMCSEYDDKKRTDVKPVTTGMNRVGNTENPDKER